MARTHFEQRKTSDEVMIRVKDERRSRSMPKKIAENNLEHIAGVEHLIAYLEPTGHEAFYVGSYTEKNQQRSPQEIRQHAQQLRQRIGQEPLDESLVLSLPSNIHPSAKEQTEGQALSAFNHNIWAWEPMLLDDLERAKEHEDNEATRTLRAIIRAGSWDSHARVTEKECLSITKSWLQKLTKHPTDPQLELSAIMNPDLEQVEALQAIFLSKTPQCGPMTEQATEFIEEKLREAWLQFNALYRDTAIRFKKEAREQQDRFDHYPLEWPHARFHRSIPKQVNGKHSDHVYDFTELHTAQQHIIELRQLRDQLYYRLLYPNLCSFIKTKTST